VKAQDILDAAAAGGAPVRRVDSAELKSFAHGHSHGGVIAICMPTPRMSETELLGLTAELNRPPLLLMLEGVDDARNLGFTIRTAEAVGVDALLIKKHLWDFDETEVARASSGALERLPLVQFGEVTLLQRLQKQGIRLYGCLAGARRTVYDVNLTRPLCIAVGGEKRGLSGAVRQICDRFITIPTLGGASSLSLSHASAMVLGESLRQRRAKARVIADAEAASHAK
jgi:23S rRNA (guanosine2251-2'-O)-methyltransferase